jgi:hypothetical protein
MVVSVGLENTLGIVDGLRARPLSQRAGLEQSLSHPMLSGIAVQAAFVDGLRTGSICRPADVEQSLTPLSVWNCSQTASAFSRSRNLRRQLNL